VFCQDWRTERDGARVEDGFDEEVRTWRTSAVLTDRERLAAEYAERYAEDHHGLEPGVDRPFWDRMFAEYTQAEVVELTMCLGSCLAFGRLNRVLGLDVACVLPSHPQRATT
jgi:alkylhydroperoxidase family enzyme